MTSAYLAISIFKKSIIPIDQLKIFLTYVNQKALKEYLNISKIYTIKKKLCTKKFIDLIFNGNKSINVNVDNELSVDEVNKTLNDYSKWCKIKCR